MKATTALQPPAQVDSLSVNTIRTLAMDAVQAANSGHPGTPMAMAPVAYPLWNDFLRFDPEDPIWPNRDRQRSPSLSQLSEVNLMPANWACSCPTDCRPDAVIRLPV